MGANPVYHKCLFPGKPGWGTSALRRRKKSGKGGGLMAEIRLMVSCHQMEEVLANRKKMVKAVYVQKLRQAEQ